MEGEFGELALLLLGPAGGIALYWGIWQHYRNTDKSHGFEHETHVEAGPMQGSDRKVDQIRGTRNTRIQGDNVADYRRRVRRLG